MSGELNRTNSVVATIQRKGHTDMIEKRIPLYKRQANPNHYDLIYSLRRLFRDNEGKEPPLHYITKVTTGTRLANPTREGPFDRDSSLNLLNAESLREWWALYDGKTDKSGERRYKLILNESHLNPWISCTICDNLALHADMRPGVMLPFCSEACCDNYGGQ